MYFSHKMLRSRLMLHGFHCHRTTLRSLIVIIYWSNYYICFILFGPFNEKRIHLPSCIMAIAYSLYRKFFQTLLVHLARRDTWILHTNICYFFSLRLKWEHSSDNESQVFCLFVFSFEAYWMQICKATLCQSSPFYHASLFHTNWVIAAG